MSASSVVAFDQPPRGFSGLRQRLAEREIVLRVDERCPFCGGSDPLGIGSCLPCAGQAGDRLVFLRRPQTRRDRRRNLDLVRSLLPPGAAEFEVGLVADGHLALAAVPENALGNVEAALEMRGLSVRSSSVRWSVASTPPAMSLLILAILGTSAAAGVLAAPWMALAGPAVGCGLWFLAQLHLLRPATEDPDRSPWLEGADQEAIVTTVTSLPLGRAKSLLLDLIRLGRLLYARAEMAGDTGVAEDTGTLIAVAAEVASDLAYVQELAAAMSLRKVGPQSDPAQPDVLLRLTASAQQLEGLLVDAIGHLGGANRRIFDEGRSGDRLSFLVHEIDRGRAAYRDAYREIEQLLAE